MKHKIFNCVSIAAALVTVVGAVLIFRALTSVIRVEPTEYNRPPSDAADDIFTDNGGQAKPQAQLVIEEIHDNQAFLQFLERLKGDEDFLSAAKLTGMSPDERITVTLKNGDGTPAANRRVSLKDRSGSVCYTGVTDETGSVCLFVSPFADSPACTPASVSVDGYSFLLSEQKTNFDFTLLDTKPNKRVLDLMVLCDTTASMADELSFLKNEIQSVFLATAEKYADWSVHFSVCFFRDEGDAYVVKTNPFTSDVTAAAALLQNETTSGGGNLSEAVHTALSKCISRMEWNGDAKLLLLLTDAPNFDSDAVRTALRKSMENAAKQGIRMIGVGGNDTNGDAAYMLRSMALLSGGSYVSLKGEADEEKDENKLCSLLCKIIERYAALPE